MHIRAACCIHCASRRVDAFCLYRRAVTPHAAHAASTAIPARLNVVTHCDIHEVVSTEFNARYRAVALGLTAPQHTCSACDPAVTPRPVRCRSPLTAMLARLSAPHHRALAKESHKQEAQAQVRLGNSFPGYLLLLALCSPRTPPAAMTFGLLACPTASFVFGRHKSERAVCCNVRQSWHLMPLTVAVTYLDGVSFLRAPALPTFHRLYDQYCVYITCIKCLWI